MKDLLKELSFDMEEIEIFNKEFQNIPSFQIELIIRLLKKYGCHKEFIKHILINRKDLFLVDATRLEYIMEAIVANGDIIEETLLEIV